MSLISIINLKKEFKTENKIIKVFDDLSLEIQEKEFLVILGPNGCGKTILLNMIAGFEKYTKGQILVKGNQISQPSKEIGFVFQELSLFPWKTVSKNVLFGLEVNKVKNAEEIATKYIDILGLSEFKHTYPNHLSTGIKQKVAIARTLTLDPDILLMDEPFSNLDVTTKKVLQQELISLWKSTNKTIIYVTHNVDEAIAIATRIVLLNNDGCIKKIINIKHHHPKDLSLPYFKKLKIDIEKIRK